MACLRNSSGLFHNVLNYMGDLDLVLPALNLSTLDAILFTKYCGQLHVLPLAVHLNFLVVMDK